MRKLILCNIGVVFNFFRNLLTGLIIIFIIAAPFLLPSFIFGIRVGSLITFMVAVVAVAAMIGYNYHGKEKD